MGQKGIEKVEFGEKTSLKKLTVTAKARAGREAVMNYGGDNATEERSTLYWN